MVSNSGDMVAGEPSTTLLVYGDGAAEVVQRNVDGEVVAADYFPDAGLDPTSYSGINAFLGPQGLQLLDRTWTPTQTDRGSAQAVTVEPLSSSLG